MVRGQRSKEWRQAVVKDTWRRKLALVDSQGEVSQCVGSLGILVRRNKRVLRSGVHSRPNAKVVLARTCGRGTGHTSWPGILQADPVTVEPGHLRDEVFLAGIFAQVRDIRSYRLETLRVKCLSYVCSKRNPKTTTRCYCGAVDPHEWAYFVKSHCSAFHVCFEAVMVVLRALAVYEACWRPWGEMLGIWKCHRQMDPVGCG